MGGNLFNVMARSDCPGDPIIRIIGFKGIGPISKLIQWRTGGPYSHVAFIPCCSYTIHKNIMCCEAREFAGVRYVSGEATHRKGTPYDVFEKQVSHDRYDLLHRFLFSKLGLGYDYLAVLGFVFRKDGSLIQDSRRWFCSEFLACGMLVSTLFESGEVRPCQVDPSEFIRMILSKGFVKSESGVTTGHLEGAATQYPRLKDKIGLLVI